MDSLVISNIFGIRSLKRLTEAERMLQEALRYNFAVWVNWADLATERKRQMTTARCRVWLRTQVPLFRPWTSWKFRYIRQRSYGVAYSQISAHPVDRKANKRPPPSLQKQKGEVHNRTKRSVDYYFFACLQSLNSSPEIVRILEFSSMFQLQCGRKVLSVAKSFAQTSVVVTKWTYYFVKVVKI